MAEWHRASASGSVDLGFDSESGQTNDLKIGIKTNDFKTKNWCRWERHLTEFPHLSVVDRWPATP